MSVPIASVGVGLSSQSNPIYQMMNELKSSIQNTRLLNTETDDALREVSSILCNPDAAGTQVGPALMRLFNTLSDSGDTSDIASKVGDLLLKIQPKSGAASTGLESLMRPTTGAGSGAFSMDASAYTKISDAQNTATRKANLTKLIDNILNGGIENMQELKTLIQALDENPGLVDDSQMKVIDERIKEFMVREISECKSTDEICQKFEEIQGIISCTSNSHLIDTLSELQFDPEVNEAVQAIAPGENVSSILSESGIEPLSESAESSASNSQGFTNSFPDIAAIEAQGANGFAGEEEDIDPSLFTPSPLSIPTPTNPTQSSGSSQDKSSVSPSSTSRIAPIKSTGTDLQAGTSTSKPNEPAPSQANAQKTAQPKSSQAPKPEKEVVLKHAPPAKEVASPEKPKPVRVELQSWGRTEKGAPKDQTINTITKPSSSKQMFRDRQGKAPEVLTQTIAMGAQANLDRRKLGLKDSDSAGMSDLLRKPKPNAGTLSKAYDEDPVGVTEQLYFILVNVAHFRMEESINNIVTPDWLIPKVEG